jgi:biopolymer transport protein ExbD
MRATHLLTVIFAATLPFAIVSAEDTAKPDADQKNEQNSNQMVMMDMNKGQMMSSWKDQEVELDKLVAEMNSASADKKVDAIAAVLTKLVEQREAMHEQMQTMMAENVKAQMNMCRMMMGMMGVKMGGDQGNQEDTDHAKHQ